MKKTLIVLTLVIVFCLFSTLAVTSKAQNSGTSITLYAGAVTSGSGPYGFGSSASDITSPGPALNLVEGTTYTMTLNNVADMPHSFEIVSSKAVSNAPLFDAGIDITNYVPAGGSGNVTFTPDKTGNFYYVCTVPGHINLGMWGNVKVSSTVAEYPFALTLMFAALTVSALATFLAKQKIGNNGHPNF